MKTYFFDTYALYELINGNPQYKQFTEKIGIVTTRLNLMELYYGILLRYDEHTAEKQYNLFKEYVIAPDDNIIKKAMKFKALNTKKTFLC